MAKVGGVTGCCETDLRNNRSPSIIVNASRIWFRPAGWVQSPHWLRFLLTTAWLELQVARVGFPLLGRGGLAAAPAPEQEQQEQCRSATSHSNDLLGGKETVGRRGAVKHRLCGAPAEGLVCFGDPDHQVLMLPTAVSIFACKPGELLEIQTRRWHTAHTHTNTQTHTHTIRLNELQEP